MYQHSEKELSVTVQDASGLEVGFCFTKSLSFLAFLTRNFKSSPGVASKSAGRGKVQGRIRIKAFHGLGLEVGHIISTHVLLTGSQLHGHTWLQGNLGR